MGLLFMTGIMGLVVLCFWAYHMTLVLRNVTTNESAKRASLSDRRQHVRDMAARVRADIAWEEQNSHLPEILSGENRAALEKCVLARSIMCCLQPH